jgi:hypothetical protein
MDHTRLTTKGCAGLIVVLMVVLSPLPASAQPLFETEHDWRITIGDGSYGVRQVVQQPGEFRQTTIHFGSHVYHTRLRAAEVAALAIGPLVLAAAVALSRWRRRDNKSEGG